MAKKVTQTYLAEAAFAENFNKVEVIEAVLLNSRSST